MLTPVLSIIVLSLKLLVYPLGMYQYKPESDHLAWLLKAKPGTHVTSQWPQYHSSEQPQKQSKVHSVLMQLMGALAGMNHVHCMQREMDSSSP